MTKELERYYNQNGGEEKFIDLLKDMTGRFGVFLVLKWLLEKLR